MKKAIITIMVIVTLLTTGTAAMLMIRGKAQEDTTVEIKTEQEAIVEETIEASEELCDEYATMIANMYIAAIYEVFGDNIDDERVTYDNYGVYYDEKFVSWDELEDIAYVSMMDEYFG